MWRGGMAVVVAVLFIGARAAVDVVVVVHVTLVATGTTTDSRPACTQRDRLGPVRLVRFVWLLQHVGARMVRRARHVSSSHCALAQAYCKHVVACHTPPASLHTRRE